MCHSKISHLIKEVKNLKLSFPFRVQLEYILINKYTNMMMTTSLSLHSNILNCIVLIDQRKTGSSQNSN